MSYFPALLEVKRFHPKAIIPTRQTSGAVGHDLHSVEDVVIPPHSIKIVNTGVGVRLPFETYARIAPRSGMSIKGIDTMAGVVDPDWTAEIKVVLFNHMSTPYDIKCGDRIAQLILERVAIPVVKEIDSLPTTERGSNGFGSTGK